LVHETITGNLLATPPRISTNHCLRSDVRRKPRPIHNSSNHGFDYVDLLEPVPNPTVSINHSPNLIGCVADGLAPGGIVYGTP